MKDPIADGISNLFVSNPTKRVYPKESHTKNGISSLCYNDAELNKNEEEPCKGNLFF